MKIFLFTLMILSSTFAQAKDSIKWNPWSEELFSQAKKENKLLILDLEAIWCHWCHVMEEQTYSNPQVVQAVSKNYIAIKVDQDSRPDIANHYEDYGWPATIIFNANGVELAKLSGYIPSEEFLPLLNKLVKNPIPEKEYSNSQGKKLPTETKKLLSALQKSIDTNYDAKVGSWSTDHKYLDRSLSEYFLNSGDKKQLDFAKRDLDANLKLLDPAWGGVYQYSTDNDWAHPHFEKIMSYQTDDILAYTLAYLVTKDKKYLDAALKINKFVKNFLTSPEGAFYTSQDADLIQGEHGGKYFSLSDQDRRKQGIPKVDEHIYSRENGWMIQALISLYAATEEKSYLAQSIKAAEYILKNRSLPGGGFRHDAKDSAGPYLSDTLAMAEGFLKIYAATGEKKWLQHSMDAANFISKHFSAKNGFVTAESNQKSIFKSKPQSDENINIARFTNLLFHYTGEKKFLEIAKSAQKYILENQSADDFYILPRLALSIGEFAAAPIHITIVSKHDNEDGRMLDLAALKYANSYKRIDWWNKADGPLLNLDTQYPEMSKPAAFACVQSRCSLPAFKPEDIATRIQQITPKK